MKKQQIVIFVLAAGCFCCELCGQDAPRREKDSPADKAERLYASAMSQYRAREWKQAEGLLEGFVKDYSSHEYAPIALMQLAYCRSELKDFDGYDKALDEVIKQFAGSPAWYIAHGSKLARRKTLKDNDGYLSLLESMLRLAPEAPLFLHGGIGGYYGIYRQYEYYPRFFEPVAARLGLLDRGSGWAMDIAEMADTPERAERALKALAKTLRLQEKELTPYWQFAHAALLKKTGKTELAETTFQNYLKAWGDDPRAISLWLLKIADAKAHDDEKTVKDGFAYLIETWPGAGSKNCYSYVGPNHYMVIAQTSLAAAVYQRLEELYNQDKFEDYTELARHYLKSFTAGGGQRRTIISRCVYLANRKDASGAYSRVASALKMLDEFFKDECPAWEQSNIIWRIDLSVLLEDYDQAAKLASELVGEKYWSARSYSTVNGYAQKNQAIEKVIAAARTRWKIPVGNPSGESAVQLTQLKGRLGDNQTRHAEEISEEMFSKHRDEAETIEAVKAMADYYFKQVLAEPRDKWMDRMVKTYPNHPLTEAVLRNQITAEQATRRYDKLAMAFDTLLSNFPGISIDTTLIDNTLYYTRMGCYDAAKDQEGKVVFARRIYGGRADAGDVYALDALAKQELSRYDRDKDNQAIGDYWSTRAGKLSGKPSQLYCLARAWEMYFGLYGYHYYMLENIRQSGAKTVIEMMQNQKMDPELKWAMAFSDVNLLAYCDDAAGAVKALDERLAQKPTWRDLSFRLDFAALGSTLGKRKMGKVGLALATKLEKACYTSRDKLAIELMLASMYNAGEDYLQASKHYLKIVDDYPVPARMYPFFERAMRALREAKSPRYPLEMERYIRKINGTQELVPGLMSSLGMFQLAQNSAAAMHIYKTLVKQYPASQGRENLGRAIEKRQK